MPKCKITTLSPLHIGNGKEYEINFNLLYQNGFYYLYNEFDIVKFFISKNIQITINFESLKQLIEKFQDEIVKSNLHIKKIKSLLKSKNRLLEHISSQNMPIVPGSSIKGAIRTAYIDKMFKNGEFDEDIKKLEAIEDEISQVENNKEKAKKKKSFIIKDINKKINNKTKNLFKNLKVSDSLTDFDTQVFKSINIKKVKKYQKYRDKKIEKISNLVEAIKPNQEFFVEIDFNKEFEDLVDICNSFYLQKYENEFENYFLDREKFKKIKLQKNQFLLNIGRFGGAELKTIEDVRSLPRTGANVDFETTTRTYALEKDIQDNIFFENSLLPFGWVLCEFIEDEEYDRLLKEFRDYEKRLIEENQKSRDEILSKIKKEKELEIEKAKKLELEKKEKAKKEAQEREKIKSMSLCERVLYNQIKQNPGVPKYTLILNGIKNGMYDDFKCEALRLAKKYMQESGRWKTETKAKKPQKDKNYQRTLQILEMLKECK